MQSEGKQNYLITNTTAPQEISWGAVSFPILYTQNQAVTRRGMAAGIGSMRAGCIPSR